jgi:hypothetical protein
MCAWVAHRPESYWTFQCYDAVKAFLACTIDQTPRPPRPISSINCNSPSSSGCHANQLVQSLPRLYRHSKTRLEAQHAAQRPSGFVRSKSAAPHFWQILEDTRHLDLLCAFL